MRLLCLTFAAAAAFAQSPPAAPSPSAAPSPPAVERAYRLLDTATKNGNLAKRIAAIQSMGIIRPDPRPVALVEALLNERDSGTRQSACSALGEMKSRASIPKLHDALNDIAGEVVFAAARALYEMGDPAGRAVLVAVLAGDQEDASGLVAGSLRDARVTVHDPRSLFLIGVRTGAGLLGPFGIGVPIAERLLKDKEASGKTAAALLLSTDTTDASKRAIRIALGDRNWTVRAGAARAVAARDLLEFYDDIVAMLDDKRDEAAYTAAAVVIRLKQPAPGPQR